MKKHIYVNLLLYLIKIENLKLPILCASCDRGKCHIRSSGMTYSKQTGMKLERELMLKLLIAALTLPSMVGYILLLSSWHKSIPVPSRHSEAVRSAAELHLIHPYQQDNGVERSSPRRQHHTNANVIRGGGQSVLAAQFYAGIYGDRREAMLGACQKMRRGRNGRNVQAMLSRRSRMLQNIIVDDKHKTLYCYIPKVACTNWKRLMMILSGRTNKTDPLTIPSWVPHELGALRRLSDGKRRMSDIRKKLDTYTKFIFVRHPMERLVSAFRNKFEKNGTSSIYFKKAFGTKILKRYRPDSTADLSNKGEGVTFSEFVKYLLDPRVHKSESYNEHWASYMTLCQPCVINYDIIGKYDTLKDDSEVVLGQIGAPEYLHFPSVVPSKTPHLVAKYLDTLPYKTRRRLYSLYEPDFRLFQYDYELNTTSYMTPPSFNMTLR